MPSPTTPDVRRERGDGGSAWRRRNSDGQGRRCHASIAGRIGRSGGETMGAVGQRRRCIAPGAAGIGHHAVEQRRTVKDLDR